MSIGFTNEERAFLEAHRIAHLATADAAGTPHVVPVCYAIGSACLYFVVDDKPKPTRTGLKRLRNLRENPRVAFIADDYDEDWRRLAFLLVQGSATIVADVEEYAQALTLLRRRYTQYQVMSLKPATHPLVRICPERTRMWRAGR